MVEQARIFWPDAMLHKSVALCTDTLTQFFFFYVSVSFSYVLLNNVFSNFNASGAGYDPT